MKKVISLLLIVCMVAGLSTVALADSQIIMNFTGGSPAMQPGASYDAGTNTLTLDGLDYSFYGGYHVEVIKLNSDLNIYLADGSENTITLCTNMCSKFAFYSDSTPCTVYITGNGSLTIDTTTSTSDSQVANNNVTIVNNTGNPVTGDQHSQYYAIIPPDEPEVEREEDPECDVNFDGTTKTVKYNNNTIVVDKWLYEHTAEEISYAYYVDLCDTNANIESIILKNDVVKTLNQKGHGFIVYNRGSTTVLTKLDEDIKNSVTVTTKEGHATYAQKKAMNTEKVLAEIEYACTSNGKATNLPAFIIVPCESINPRCFYLIDDNHIGEWPCTYVEGYCLFDRYLDGTYVICE